MVAQIVGRAQRRPGRQQLRAAGRKHLVRKQQLDIEPGIMSGAVADRDVEIALGQIDDLVGRGDPHIDFGALLLKPVQPQHQPFRGKGGRRGNGQGAGVVMRPQSPRPRRGSRQRLRTAPAAEPAPRRSARSTGSVGETA